MKALSNVSSKGIFLSIIALCAGLSSCKSSTIQMIVITNIDDFKKSLQDAGAEVQTMGIRSLDSFTIPGQIFLLDGNEIEVYEFASESEREIESNTIASQGVNLGGTLAKGDVRPTIWETGYLIVVYRGHDGGVILLLGGLMGDPLTYEAPEADGPYPPSVVAAIRHLAQDLKIDPGLIQVMGFKVVEWQDSCLEVPNPDEGCAQTLTSGWRVMMRASGELYEVHTDLTGENVHLLR